MTNNYRKFSKGFGILEVLISSAIIIVVLGTLVFIAQSSLTNAAYMQERAQAIGLASEGMETVRQIRDSNYIDGDPDTKWNTLSDSDSQDLIIFGANYYLLGLAPLSGVASRPRIINRVLPATIIDGVSYTRKVTFQDINGNQLLSGVSNSGGNGFIATVSVTWNGSGGKAGSAEVKELITNSRFVY